MGEKFMSGSICWARKLSLNLYLSIKTKVKLLVEKLGPFIKLNVHLQATITKGRRFLLAKGIDKELLYMEIKEKAKSLKERQGIIEKLEQHALPFGNSEKQLRGTQLESYKKMLELIFESNRNAINELDKEIQLGMRKIKQSVPAQIEVTREAYPGDYYTNWIQVVHTLCYDKWHF